MGITKYDLRLGNMFEQGIVWKISGRAGAKVHLHGKGKWYKGFRSEVSVEDLKPIVLTPQILVDWCEFEFLEKDKNYYFFTLNGFELKYINGTYYFWLDDQIIVLECLHELQNLYKVITKQELEIKG